MKEPLQHIHGIVDQMSYNSFHKLSQFKRAEGRGAAKDISLLRQRQRQREREREREKTSERERERKKTSERETELPQFRFEPRSFVRNAAESTMHFVLWKEDGNL